MSIFLALNNYWALQNRNDNFMDFDFNYEHINIL